MQPTVGSTKVRPCERFANPHTLPARLHTLADFLGEMEFPSLEVFNQKLDEHHHRPIKGQNTSSCYY